MLQASFGGFDLGLPENAANSGLAFTNSSANCCLVLALVPDPGPFTFAAFFILFATDSPRFLYKSVFFMGKFSGSLEDGVH